jgi:hypothetical protein
MYILYFNQIILLFFFFFNCGIRVWTQGFRLARRVLSCLSHQARLTSSIVHSLYCPAPLWFSSFKCVLLYYLHIQMQCTSILFTLYHSFFLSCLAKVLWSDRPTITITFSLGVCVCIHVFKIISVFVCTFISWVWVPTYEGKYAAFVLLSPAYFP